MKLATFDIDGIEYKIVLLDEREEGVTTDPTLLVFRGLEEEAILTFHPLPSTSCTSQGEGHVVAPPLPEDEEEYVSRCPACGDPIDYCQGHGEIGDPAGFAILAAHDEGDHSKCHPEGCDEAPA